jgi:hypothetical protein
LELQDRKCVRIFGEYRPDRFMLYAYVQTAGECVSEFVLLKDHYLRSLCRRVHRDVVRSKFTMGQGACSSWPSRKVLSRRSAERRVDHRYDLHHRTRLETRKHTSTTSRAMKIMQRISLESCCVHITDDRENVLRKERKAVAKAESVTSQPRIHHHNA